MPAPTHPTMMPIAEEVETVTVFPEQSTVGSSKKDISKDETEVEFRLSLMTKI